MDVGICDRRRRLRVTPLKHGFRLHGPKRSVRVCEEGQGGAMDGRQSDGCGWRGPRYTLKPQIQRTPQVIQWFVPTCELALSK
jgi:hypothetical protein